MIDLAITWMLTYPLQAVGVLAAAGIIVGVVLVPGLHHVSHHGHPRV